MTAIALAAGARTAGGRARKGKLRGRQTPGYLAAWDILKDIGALEEKVRAWVRTHGKTCRCGFCSADIDPDTVKWDMTALLYQLETISCLIGSNVTDPTPRPLAVAPGTDS